jgi:hypothetical protein
LPIQNPAGLEPFVGKIGGRVWFPFLARAVAAVGRWIVAQRPRRPAGAYNFTRSENAPFADAVGRYAHTWRSFVLARPGVVDRRWPLTAAHGRSSRTRVDVVSTKVRGSELGWACRMAIGMATPPVTRIPTHLGGSSGL